MDVDRYRFYAPLLFLGEVPLPEDQVHHALHVLRLADRTRVVVFDGRGKWAEGVLRTQKRSAAISVTGEIQEEAAPKSRLTIATAVPKADRAQWLVEQASQLGVTRLVWLACDRGVVKPKEGGEKMEKWQRLAIESAKQCGRMWVMEVCPMQTVEEVLRTDATVLWLEPHAGVALGEVGGSDLLALVGPEGGWSEREEKLLAGHSGILRVRLTPTILRIETACAAIAAVVNTRG